MVKYCTSETILNFKWNEVARVFWNRYPNPYSTHVLSEDVVSRRVVDGKLWTTRIITKTNKLPKWGAFLVPSSTRFVHMVEESIIDPIKKTFITYTRNMGLTHILSVSEKCHYGVHTDGSTICLREMWADSKIYGLRRPIEAFAIERFKKNVHSTIQGLEHVLTKAFTSFPPPSSESNSVMKSCNVSKKPNDLSAFSQQKVSNSYTSKTAV